MKSPETFLQFYWNIFKLQSIYDVELLKIVVYATFKPDNNNLLILKLIMQRIQVCRHWQFSIFRKLKSPDPVHKPKSKNCWPYDA